MRHHVAPAFTGIAWIYRVPVVVAPFLAWVVWMGAEITVRGSPERDDLVAFGRPYLANPDLVERVRAAAPLTSPDFSTFQGAAAVGPDGHHGRHPRPWTLELPPRPRAERPGVELDFARGASP